MNLVDNFEEILYSLYGKDEQIIKQQLLRYNRLFEIFYQSFESKDVFLFSTPGRTEISGNHTDHNLGRVLAASIDMDSIAVANRNDSSEINIISEGYDAPFNVDLSDLGKNINEEGTTNSLIRGIAARFVELEFEIGGFDAVMTSNVLPGSGLSSSASVEVLIGTILNALYNESKINNEELAKIGQWAENNYFGKPCGLMDQMACAIGGIIAIDFKDSSNPVVEKVDFEFENQGYKLLIVDTGANHEDLTEDYASIPNDMNKVANLLGKQSCREIDYNDYLDNLINIRNKVDDRAALRVFHFINENKRVVKQINALKQGNFQEFLIHVANSGNSSFKWLQNIYTTKNVKEQGVSISLALTEEYINKIGVGACRIHGGGFAGTILVFLPDDRVEDYKSYIEEILGSGKVIILNIRSQGSVCLNNL